MPIYIREGGIISLGPIMNYIEENKVHEIILRIAKFKHDGKSKFVVPVNDEEILIEYIASRDEHKIIIGKSDVHFKIDTIGSDKEEFTIFSK